MKQLVQYGGDIEARDASLMTPLMTIVENIIDSPWQVELLHLLLLLGADPSSEDSKHAGVIDHLVRHVPSDPNKTLFLRAAASLVAVHPTPQTLSPNTVNTIFDNFPPGVERCIDSLRQFRTDKCLRLL